MDLLTGLKVLIVIIMVLLFLLVAYKTLKALSSGKAFLYILIEAVVFTLLTFAVQWGVTQSFIKVELRKFHNTPLPTSEKLALKGCVKNVGRYKASTVTLHIKVVNNASGGSFGDSDAGRVNSLEKDIVVAKNLAKGTIKCFTKRIKYPPYFKLANIRAHISAQ